MANSTISSINSSLAASAELTPKSATSAQKIEVCLVATTCYGAKVALKPKTEDQATRLTELYETLFSGQGKHCTFHLNKLVSEVDANKSYRHSSDDTVVKELRKLAEEITGYQDAAWEMYTTKSRSAENAPTGFVRNQTPENYDKQLTDIENQTTLDSGKVKKAREVLKDSRSLLSTLVTDLEKKDKEHHQAALQAQERLNSLHDDAVIFAAGCDENLEKRWELAQQILQIDLNKDREYLEDVVRLKCSDRASYIKDSKELEDLTKYPMPNPPKLSLWQRVKNFVSGVEDELPPGAGVHRSDGAEVFFVRLIEAKDSEIEELLDSSLFNKTFGDLHPVDQDELRKKFKEQFSPGAPAISSSSSSSSGAAQLSATSATPSPATSSSAEAQLPVTPPSSLNKTNATSSSAAAGSSPSSLANLTEEEDLGRSLVENAILNQNASASSTLSSSSSGTAANESFSATTTTTSSSTTSSSSAAASTSSLTPTLSSSSSSSIASTSKAYAAAAVNNLSDDDSGDSDSDDEFGDPQEGSSEYDAHFPENESARIAKDLA